MDVPKIKCTGCGTHPILSGVYRLWEIAGYLLHCYKCQSPCSPEFGSKPDLLTYLATPVAVGRETKLEFLPPGLSQESCPTAAVNFLLVG